MEWFNRLSLDAQNDLWVIAVGAMTNTACALVGCYLVLRRMSLLGDAISHAVLPGLVVAFVFSGSLSVVPMFVGALVVGLLTAALTQTLHRQVGVPEDASMGVVFTSLFALGVILIKRYAHRVDLDPDCVLYGLLEFVGFHLARIGPYEFPRAMLSVGSVLVLNVAVIVIFWKELLVSSFDPALATTMGFRSGLVHYALMALVALTTVASFEQVGSILVIAMLIVPGATAHLLTDRLGRMLWIAAGIAVGAAVIGQMAAVWLNTNTAGTMAAVAGIGYLAAALASPRYGILGVLARNLASSVRVVREDLLAMFYRLEELNIERALGWREAARAVGGGLLARLALLSLQRRGEIRRDGAVLRLTDSGRNQARLLVRSHRLWEAYLVHRLGLAPDHVHEPATRMEHYIDRGLQDKLADAVARTPTDPHGRAIPKNDS